MRKTCEQAKTEKVVVATIFPGKPQGFPIVVHVVWDLSTYKNREGDILPSLLSCIDYQFPESDRHHQTAYFSFIGDFVDGITRRAVLVNANHGRFSIIAPPEMKIVRFKTPIAN
jgi:hypothetical protein